MLVITVLNLTAKDDLREYCLDTWKEVEELLEELNKDKFNFIIVDTFEV
jgi:hypothetical protein